jgi:hypothetical protein
LGKFSGIVHTGLCRIETEEGQILVSAQQSDEWKKTLLTCFVELCHGDSQNLLHFAMTQW